MSRPALRGEVKALGQALHETGDADLVDHLGELAGARTAEAAAGAGEGHDHRLGAGEVTLLAAAHDGEHAILGAGLATGDRRIDEAEAEGLGLGLKLTRDIGRSGVLSMKTAPFAMAGTRRRDRW